MNTFFRYLKLHLRLIQLNVSGMLIYRVNLYAGLIATVSWVAFAVIAVVVYTNQSARIAGWSLPELITLTGVFSIVTGLAYSLFLQSFMSLAEKINTGDLDLVLTKPIDSQFLATSQMMSLQNLARFICGIVLVMIGTNHTQVSFQTVSIFTSLLLASIAILYSIWLLLVTLNFYTRRLDNVIGLLLELFDQTSRTPSDTFRLASSWAFNFLLPLFMVVSFPTKVLWGKLSIELTLLTIVTSVTLFFLSRKFWQYSLRHYSSASS